MALAPIWKDRIVTLATSGDYADFEIRQSTAAGPLLYSGRAYPRPGETDIKTRINEICASYLGALLPDFGNRFTPMQVSETFVTLVGGVTKDTVTFVNDWSYDPDFDPDTDPLAEPINGVLDPRQWLVYTILDGAVTARLDFEDGTTQNVPLVVGQDGSFNSAFNLSYNVATSGAGAAGTAVLNLADYPGVETVTVGGIVYTVRPNGCARYAIYYVNAHGGWDSLLLEKAATLRDALTRYTALHDYDNADPVARGRKDYAIEVTPAWTLRTGVLTDAQSLRMHHLLNSTEVYLQDLADGTFYPVVLTDTEAERKTYKGTGRQLITYTFNAQLAQERFRR